MDSNLKINFQILAWAILCLLPYAYGIEYHVGSSEQDKNFDYKQELRNTKTAPDSELPDSNVMIRSSTPQSITGSVTGIKLASVPPDTLLYATDKYDNNQNSYYSDITEVKFSEKQLIDSDFRQNDKH